MQWIELTIKTAPAAIDLVCDRLTVLGFDSFIIDDQEQFHEFLEQNRQYWDYVDEDLEKQMQGLSQIRLYLEQNASVPETVESLKSQLAALRAQYPSVDFGSLDVQLANVKDEDWENNWKRYYQPLPIGERLLVVPEWLHPENPENRVEVLLDPGMIFGTGAHASTQMCMRELERAIQGGERVLEVRGEYLPLVELWKVFEVDGAKTEATQGIVVILQSAGRRYALLVDQLIGQHQVVVKNLESNYRKVPGISAATILGDGSVALIVDVSALQGLNREQRVAYTAA